MMPATPTEEVETHEFPLLRYSGLYSPCTFSIVPDKDHAADYPSFEQWLQIFRASTPTFKNTAAKDPSVKDAAQLAKKFEKQYLAYLEEVNTQFKKSVKREKDAPPFLVDIIELCCKRDNLLRELGFQDCFLGIKAKENESALSFLGSLLAEMDALPKEKRLLTLIEGVFAGNIFDLGAASSAALYDGGSGAGDFKSTRTKLAKRPWLFDDFDHFEQTLRTTNYEKAILFVDNAGADVVLGMIPFARELVKRGTTVVLAANEVASINDITAAELKELLPKCNDQIIDEAFKKGKLRVISSGNDMPVIDLRKVSLELVQQAQDADLVVLEGMGRAIETNLHVHLQCDVLKLGMIKHPEVATALNGKIYDVVCKFDMGTNRPENCGACQHVPQVGRFLKESLCTIS